MSLKDRMEIARRADQRIAELEAALAAVLAERDQARAERDEAVEERDDYRPLIAALAIYGEGASLTALVEKASVLLAKRGIVP